MVRIDTSPHVAFVADHQARIDLATEKHPGDPMRNARLALEPGAPYPSERTFPATASIRRSARDRPWPEIFLLE